MTPQPKPTKKKFDAVQYNKDLARVEASEREQKHKRNQALELRIRGMQYAITILQYAVMQLEKQRGFSFNFDEMIPPNANM